MAVDNRRCGAWSGIRPRSGDQGQEDAADFEDGEAPDDAPVDDPLAAGVEADDSVDEELEDVEGLAVSTLFEVERESLR